MTLLVMPNAVVVYDCRITADDQERIVAHLNRYIPVREINGTAQRWIDWFICSHRDRDHFQGIGVLNEHFPLRGIVDPGTTSGSVDGDDNQYYMRLRRQLRSTYGEGAVIEPEPSINPLFDFAGVRFYCLCSGIDDPPSEDGHYGNNVFQVAYGGNRVLFTGDSDWRAWKERIVPTFEDSGLLNTTVLVASHHGSRSFFVDTDSNIDEKDAWGDAYEEHLELIRPAMTVISCGDQGIHNHPNPTAHNKYKAATAHQQVYLTREKGTLIGQFHEDGRWTVTPSRFLRAWTFDNFCPTGKDMQVKCVAENESGIRRDIASGEAVSVGHKLRFEILTSGGLVGDISKAKYTFEVSNAGEGSHATHDEIYDKERQETGAPNSFQRDLSFLGTHLLRCTVSSGNHKAQKVFAVRGVRG